jgi:hypothetical protein
MQRRPMRLAGISVRPHDSAAPRSSTATSRSSLLCPAEIEGSPEHLDAVEAAIVIFNYVSAHQMLHRTAARARECYPQGLCRITIS